MNRPLHLVAFVAAVSWVASLANADVHQELLAGRRLTPQEVADLESKLVANPDDMTARIKLLGSYSSRQFDPDREPERRRQHILWVIEHHPESQVAGLPDAQLIHELDPHGYAEARWLWLDQTREHSTNPEILGNAASFLLLADHEEAERLLLKAQELEPENPKWADRLGHLYALRRRSSKEARSVSAVNSLEQFERSHQGAASRKDRFYGLSDLAKAAFEAGDMQKATQYASELLAMSVDYPRDWNYGNAIHHGNLVLGRVALRNGDVDRAAEFLLKAGRTPGSPQLNSFGPNMALAKELLEKGEKKAVLEYFELCRNFWEMHRDSLDRWTQHVAAGRPPDFRANLNY